MAEKLSSIEDWTFSSAKRARFICVLVAGKTSIQYKKWQIWKRPFVFLLKKGTRRTIQWEQREWQLCNVHSSSFHGSSDGLVTDESRIIERPLTWNNLHESVLQTHYSILSTIIYLVSVCIMKVANNRDRVILVFVLCQNRVVRHCRSYLDNGWPVRIETSSKTDQDVSIFPSG